MKNCIIFLLMVISPLTFASEEITSIEVVATQVESHYNVECYAPGGKQIYRNIEVTRERNDYGTYDVYEVRNDYKLVEFTGPITCIFRRL